MTLPIETLLLDAFTPIHNHGTWGIVATLKGQAKKKLSKRSPSPKFSDKIEQTHEQILKPGDVISFTTEAIYCV